MTPIGHSHTQLTSNIALWAPGHRPSLGKTAHTPAGPTYPTECIGPLPPLLARVHRAELVERLVLRMRAALLNPVQVELLLGYRRVQILQNTVVEFGREGWLSAYAWELLPGGRPCLVPRPLSFVSAVGQGHEGRWLSGFALGLMLEHRRYHYQRCQLSSVQGLLPTYVMWVMSRLNDHLAQTMEMAQVHQAIERALLSNPHAVERSTAHQGLDAAVLAQAKERLRFAGHPVDLAPTLKDYQDCQRCLQNNAY